MDKYSKGKVLSFEKHSLLKYDYHHFNIFLTFSFITSPYHDISYLPSINNIEIGKRCLKIVYKIKNR